MKITRKQRKLELTIKERKIQKKVKEFLKDGDSKSRHYWVVKNKLNKIQWRIYRLSCFNKALR